MRVGATGAAVVAARAAGVGSRAQLEPKSDGAVETLAARAALKAALRSDGASLLRHRMTNCDD